MTASGRKRHAIRLRNLMTGLISIDDCIVNILLNLALRSNIRYVHKPQTKEINRIVVDNSVLISYQEKIFYHIIFINLPELPLSLNFHTLASHVSVVIISNPIPNNCHTSVSISWD